MDLPSHHLLDWLRQGEGHASRIALEEGERTLSYGGLWRAVSAAAALIESRAGARPGPVLLLGENSMAYVVAMLGALRSGRAVADVNHQERRERLGRVAASLDPSLVVAGEGVILPGLPGVERLSLDEIDTAERAEGPHATAAGWRAAGAEDLAFVVFTSGSTGDPKGVMLSQENVRAVAASILDYLPLTPRDRYALVLPLFHTYAKSVVTTTLRAGGRVVLEKGFADLPGFVRSLAERRVTVLSAVPYHVNMLLRRAPLESADLSALRILTVSGSHLAPSAFAELAERLPGVRPYFMYGLTESSTRACAATPEDVARKPGSCGRPIAGVALRIVDDDGRPLGPHETGEVTLSGPNVMQGYWKEPELSAAVLRDGWLHTGDVGHVDEEGFLFLSGRTRDLIKVAGERISAREIEDVLAGHPGLVESCAVGVPHPLLGEVVRLYAVKKDERLDEASLRAWCAERLTHHRLPRSFVFLDSLPKTASGKVRKHELPGV